MSDIRASSAVVNCLVPVGSVRTLHHVALPPFAALDELVVVVVREVEVAGCCVLWGARVAVNN